MIKYPKRKTDKDYSFSRTQILKSNALKIFYKINRSHDRD